MMEILIRYSQIFSNAQLSVSLIPFAPTFGDISYTFGTFLNVSFPCLKKYASFPLGKEDIKCFFGFSIVPPLKAIASLILFDLCKIKSSVLLKIFVFIILCSDIVTFLPHL